MNRARTKKTRGAAVAEMAVALPLPLLFLLGTIDTGQYANVYQTMSNASLEGARVASKASTLDVASVESAVLSYLDNAFPNASSSTLSGVVSVSISDQSTGTTLGNSLAGVATGAKLQVDVSMPYSAVRFISGLSVLNSQTVQMSTVIRRQ